jgi:hypothetical protein
VAEHWEEIQALADSEQRERLAGLIAGSTQPDPAEARAALADELLDLLPPDHPVTRVLLTRTMYSGRGNEQSAAALADSLRRLSMLVLASGESAWPAPGVSNPAAAEPAPEPPPSGHAGRPDDFDRHVQARLLALPSLSADDAWRGHIEPDDSRLIRLPGPDGAVRLPAFQFTPAGEPWPVVQEVNQVLDAARDPWGVTCWWVHPHERLGVVPADLLGRGDDELLRWAALTVEEEY